MIAGGVVGLLAVAGAAGGGGGGSNTPVAVSPSPPAPTPAPAPTPPADTTPPAQPEITSGAVANQSRPILTGKAEAGSTVRVSYDINRDGTPDVVYQTTAAADGSFQINLATAQPVSGAMPAGGLPDGQIAVSVVAIDASNNASAATNLNLSVSATPPDAPRITGVTDNVGAQTGPVANGGSTDDLTPTLTGTLSSALGAGDRLVIYRNGVQISASPTVTGTTWTVEDSGLALGQSYVYEARVVNAVGNSSSTSNGWQILTQADPAPTFPTTQITGMTDNVAPVVGNVANGGSTNDRTPTFTGTLSTALGPGQTVEVLRNGQPTAVQATVTGQTFSFTDTLATDGTYTYSVRVVQGTTAGPTSAGYSIVLDTVANATATITTITDNVAPGVGTITNGGQTNDTTPTLAGTVSAALGPGETIQILRDGVVVHEITAAPGNRWTWTDAGLQIGQDYSYTVRFVDAAGNVGRASTAYRIRVVATQRDDDPALTEPSDIVVITDDDPDDTAITAPAAAQSADGSAAGSAVLTPAALSVIGNWLQPTTATAPANVVIKDDSAAGSTAAGAGAGAGNSGNSAGNAGATVTLEQLVAGHGTTPEAEATAASLAAESVSAAVARLLA